MEKNITVNRKRAKKLTVSHKKAKITTVNRKSYCPIETLKEVIDHLTYFWLVSISEGVLVGVVNALKTEQKPKIGVVWKITFLFFRSFSVMQWKLDRQSRKQKRKKQPITRPRSKHFD